jgi:hypothetical protein
MKTNELKEMAERHNINIAEATTESFRKKTGVNVCEHRLWMLRRYAGVARVTKVRSRTPLQEMAISAGKDMLSIAFETGVDYTTLLRWARKGIPNIEQIAKLCEVLRVPVFDLVNKQPK